MKRVAAFLVVIAVSFSAFNADRLVAQDTSTDLMKVYPREVYLAEIDELTERLILTHPQPYEFVSEGDFRSLVDAKKRSVSDSTTMGEFLWVYSELISSIGCSHTTMGFFNQEDGLLPASLRFPVDANFIRSRLFVTDPLINSDVISAGDEVISINGVPIEDVRAEIFRHIPSDGHNQSYKESFANVYLTAYVSYYFQFADSYRVQTATSHGDIPLRTLDQYAYKPLVSPDDACQDRLCFRLLSDMSTALVTVRSTAYYGEDAQVFESFVDSSFAAIAGSNTDYLILDFRGNRGGSSFANSYLLQHFANRPFAWFGENSAGDDQSKRELQPFDSRFLGRVFILTDGHGLSSTGHFLSLVKANGFATLVGEESGSTYTTNDNSTNFESSTIGIEYRIAQSTFFTTAKGFPKDRGILPDHEVFPRIEEVLSNKDSVLDYTLGLIDADRSERGADRSPSSP